MRFARMTTRRWMRLMGVIAITSTLTKFGWTAWYRSQICNAYQLCASMEPMHCGRWQVAPQSDEWLSRRRAKMAHYYRTLESKWRHAARYPWLPVEPDPREPE